MPTLEDWQIAPYYRTAREVGGDFYDFFELEDGRVALVVAATCSMLRAVALALNSYSPGEVLSRVNEVLLARIPPNMFVTPNWAIRGMSSALPLRYTAAMTADGSNTCAQKS